MNDVEALVKSLKERAEHRLGKTLYDRWDDKRPRGLYRRPYKNHDFGSLICQFALRTNADSRFPNESLPHLKVLTSLETAKKVGVDAEVIIKDGWYVSGDDQAEWCLPVNEPNRLEKIVDLVVRIYRVSSADV